MAFWHFQRNILMFFLVFALKTRDVVFCIMQRVLKISLSVSTIVIMFFPMSLFSEIFLVVLQGMGLICFLSEAFEKIHP